MSQIRWFILWGAAIAGLIGLRAATLPGPELGRRLRADPPPATDRDWLWLAAAGGLGLLVMALIERREGRLRAGLITAIGRWSSAIAAQRPEEPLPMLNLAPVQIHAQPSEVKRLREIADSADQLRLRYNHLLEERGRIADALRSMQEGIVAFDSHLQLLLINAAARRMLEIESDASPGKPLVELVRRPQVVELVQRTHRGGMVHESVVAVGPQGKRQLRLRASPLQNSGRGDPLAGQERVFGVLLLVSDVTRLAKLESMRRDFTANVSHELKTPLASIQAYAETLLIGAIEDPEANRRFVQEIATQADRLHALIHDLLQLARLDAQPEAVHLGPVQVPPIIDDVLRSHEPIAAARGVRLLHLAPPIPAVVGDLESLRTIFSNLVSNAIRYNRDGGEVEVSYSRGGGRVEVAVRDTGVGIAPEEHDRIFERFYRIDKARSIDAGGTGLGLAIVKNLIQQVGGEVRLESRPGVGTTFFVGLEEA